MDNLTKLEIVIGHPNMIVYGINAHKNQRFRFLKHSQATFYSHPQCKYLILLVWYQNDDCYRVEYGTRNDFVQHPDGYSYFRNSFFAGEIAMTDQVRPPLMNFMHHVWHVDLLHN